MTWFAIEVTNERVEFSFAFDSYELIICDLESEFD